MNNQQNEQAQTNEQTSKPKKKPLFQEGTFLYKITYEFTDKVKAGQISFAKVFWIGFIFIFILNIFTLTVFDLGEIVKKIVEVIWCMIWARHLWFARKQVYHPAWFYIGFGLVSTMVAIIVVSFGIRFS